MGLKLNYGMASSCSGSITVGGTSASITLSADGATLTYDGRTYTWVASQNRYEDGEGRSVSFGDNGNVQITDVDEQGTTTSQVGTWEVDDLVSDGMLMDGTHVFDAPGTTDDQWGIVEGEVLTVDGVEYAYDASEDAYIAEDGSGWKFGPDGAIFRRDNANQDWARCDQVRPNPGS